MNLASRNDDALWTGPIPYRLSAAAATVPASYSQPPRHRDAPLPKATLAGNVSGLTYHRMACSSRYSVRAPMPEAATSTGPAPVSRPLPLSVALSSTAEPLEASPPAASASSSATSPLTLCSSAWRLDNRRGLSSSYALFSFCHSVFSARGTRNIRISCCLKIRRLQIPPRTSSNIDLLSTCAPRSALLCSALLCSGAAQFSRRMSSQPLRQTIG